MAVRKLIGVCAALTLFATGSIQPSYAQDSETVRAVISDSQVADPVSQSDVTASPVAAETVAGTYVIANEFAPLPQSQTCQIPGCSGQSANCQSNECPNVSLITGQQCTGECQECSGRHRHHPIRNYRANHAKYFQYEAILSCPGDRLGSILEAQKSNGRLAQLFFFRFHFSFDAKTKNWSLSPAGVRNVYQVGRIWYLTPGPIMVEPTGVNEDDQSRMDVVRVALAEASIGDSIVVQLGTPLNRGLGGTESEMLYQQRLQAKPLTTGGTGGSSSFGGGIGLGSASGSGGN